MSCNDLKFKVGDMVKVIGLETNYSHRVGTIVKVLDGENMFPYVVELDASSLGDSIELFMVSEIELYKPTYYDVIKKLSVDELSYIIDCPDSIDTTYDVSEYCEYMHSINEEESIDVCQLCKIAFLKNKIDSALKFDK